MHDAIKVVRKQLKETVTSVDSQLCQSLLKFMETFFAPYVISDANVIPPFRLKALAQMIEPWFFFALVWSVGATCDDAGRALFDEWLRQAMRDNNAVMPFPDSDLVYDFALSDDGAISSTGMEEKAEDEDTVVGPLAWLSWVTQLEEFHVDPNQEYSSIMVPTGDTLRYSYVLGRLVQSSFPVMVVGPTGTAKTLTVTDKLQTKMESKFAPHFITFSARTSANQTQDILDSKMDKRRRGIFGPPLGQVYVMFVDDLNMPAKEEYGAQPPIELLRQFMDHDGW